MLPLISTAISSSTGRCRRVGGSRLVVVVAVFVTSIVVVAAVSVFIIILLIVVIVGLRGLITARAVFITAVVVFAVGVAAIFVFVGGTGTVGGCVSTTVFWMTGLVLVMEDGEGSDRKGDIRSPPFLGMGTALAAVTNKSKIEVNCEALILIFFWFYIELKKVWKKCGDSRIKRLNQSRSYTLKPQCVGCK